jgi:hypothetical protein
MKYANDEAFWGYEDLGTGYYIEGRDGSMLIGDQLPKTEAEARLLCRVANRADQHARKRVQVELSKHFQKFNP